MPVVKVLRGLPASGKSIWALEFLKNNTGWKRVNKDLLREMFDGGEWSKGNEKLILWARNALITQFLTEGLNVIVDDTNLHPKHLKEIQEIVPADTEVEELFFDVPLMECILRDAGRPNPVGQKVIYRMWEQFLRSKALQRDPGQPSAVIVDVDGTLAEANGRGWFDWDQVRTDSCNGDIANLVAMLCRSDYRIIVTSGRPEKCRADTAWWLSENNIPYHHLYMRKDNDNRKDSEVKLEIYREFIKPVYHVEYVLDDRDQVVAMWRHEGLRVLQVDYGFF